MGRPPWSCGNTKLSDSETGKERRIVSEYLRNREHLNNHPVESVRSREVSNYATANTMASLWSAGDPRDGLRACRFPTRRSGGERAKSRDPLSPRGDGGRIAIAQGFGARDACGMDPRA